MILFEKGTKMATNLTNNSENVYFSPLYTKAFDTLNNTSLKELVLRDISELRFSGYIPCGYYKANPEDFPNYLKEREEFIDYLAVIDSVEKNPKGANMYIDNFHKDKSIVSWMTGISADNPDFNSIMMDAHLRTRYIDVTRLKARQIYRKAVIFSNFLEKTIAPLEVRKELNDILFQNTRV